MTPTPGELAAVAPINPASTLGGGRPAADYARALGLDLAELAADTGAEARAKVLRWLDPSIRTRPTKHNPDGRARRERVASCGTLYAARRGENLGTAHKWCRDRLCPACMERRQRTEAALLRRWVRAVEKRGGVLLFPTLTQVKQDVRLEDAAGALARLYQTRRAMMNTKSKSGQRLRRFVAGGIWCVELSWAYRGQVNRDGSVVAFSGWHPHLHGVVELTPPPDDLELRVGAKRSREIWARMAGEELRRAWLAENPEARSVAQKVKPVDPTRIGQVCKYPLKPFELAAPARSREAALALHKKRTHDAWGTWRGWRKKADELLAADRAARGELEQPRIEFADATFQGTAMRAQWGERVYFHPPGGEDPIGVPAVDVLAAVQRDPRSLQRQAADAGAAGHLQARGPPRGPPGDSLAAQPAPG